jgi:hypothetical protein
MAATNAAEGGRRACRKDRIVMNPDFAWCLEKHPHDCPFSMVFGATYICCRALEDGAAKKSAGQQPPPQYRRSDGKSWRARDVGDGMMPRDQKETMR